MLYFLTDGRNLKIGVTSSPAARLRSFQTGNPRSCAYIFTMDLKNEYEIERLMHERLAHCATKEGGEWFDVSYADALDHLFALRKHWHLMGGDRTLALASPEKPPIPRLEDHHEQFVRWLREVWYAKNGYPVAIPLEELWGELYAPFFRQDVPPSDDEFSAFFSGLKDALSEQPGRVGKGIVPSSF